MTLVPGCSPTVDIWLCSPLQLAKLYVRTITLADVDIEVSDEVTCLGIVLDSILTLAANVKKRTCRESFLSTVTTACCSPHSADAAKTLVHALITVRIDYCNSVLYGVTTTNLRPLQSVINAAVRLITGKRKFDHITHRHPSRLAQATSPLTHPIQVVFTG